MASKGKKARKREERRRAARTRANRRNAIVWSGLATIAAVVIGFVALRTPPEELAEVQVFPAQGRDHLAAGEAPPEYNSDPPTSGDHSGSAAQCGIYISEVPDVVQIHNLEHGAVVIQYEPDLSPSEVEALRTFARTKPSHILVAPRSDLADPVVVTSWTRMLRLDRADIETIGAYYDEFAHSGPEVGVPCPFEIDQAS